MGKKKKQNPAGRDAVIDLRRRRDTEYKIAHLAAPLCAAHGLELVCVEFQREPGGRVLRLTIDRPAPDNEQEASGVSLDDCAAFSREAGDMLDAALEDQGPYRLEVSSPGPERLVAWEADFIRFAGKRIRIRCIEAPGADDRVKFSGILDGVTDGVVRLNTGDGLREIALDNIARARLMAETGNDNGESGC
ncbi:MAG: ribosome maturation factor [Desulfobacterales bacterium]|nr:MAG: ribosome maturation factor [Desulfobacterales bacterium]